MAADGPTSDYVIVRNEIQDDQDDGGIELHEWQAVLDQDPSLEELPFMWGRNPKDGSRIQIPLVGGVRWTGHPTGVDLPFYWSNGQIVCGSADQHTAAKVRELAVTLGARCEESPY